jgi:hypothetical protein
LLIAALLLSGCGTDRFYAGAKLPPEQVAVFHVGDTIVLHVDGVPRRGGYFGSPRIEVMPGRHTFTLAFEKAARPVGAKEMPPMRGEGTCTLEIAAEVGKQYWFGSRAAGADWTGLRWDGKWQAWVRDPSVGDENDIVARCDSQPAAEEVQETPAAAAAPDTQVKTDTLIAAASPATVPVPQAPLVAPVAQPIHLSAAFQGDLDPAVWIVRSRDNYRVIVRRLCTPGRCSTRSYLQALVPHRVVSDGVEQVVMQERTTVPIEEASAATALVEDVGIVDRQGTFAFELRISDADDPSAAPVRLLVFPLPDGGYRSAKAVAEP